MTTNAYIRGVKTLGWEPFSMRLWQRNYYEHIVRDEEDLERIRTYIADNPRNWPDDPENPDGADTGVRPYGVLPNPRLRT
jgi:hypothetical protein